MKSLPPPPLSPFFFVKHIIGVGSRGAFHDYQVHYLSTDTLLILAVTTLIATH